MASPQEDRWTEAAWKMRQRREADSNLFRFMLMVRDRYNAPSSFALPDVHGEPEVYAPVPMLLADAIDSHATRAASQDPTIVCPALDATRETGVRSLEYAGIRRNALQAAWFNAGMTNTVLPRAFRQLCGYGTWNMVVVPDFEYECARIELRDPLTAYPELRTPEDTRPPLDCGYVYGKSAQWLKRYYPSQMSEWLGKAKTRDDDLWDVVEWVDPEWVLIGVLGPRKVTGSGNVLYPGMSGNVTENFDNGMLLRAWRNKAGMTTVGTPRRATLDMVFGQVARMVPIADLYGKLSALNFIAAEKEVFPAIALVGNQIGRTPTLEGGEWADGRTNDINTVLDGDVKVVSASPGPMTRAALSDTERAIRQSTGQPGIASGDTSLGSMRSGNTVNAFASLAMDPQLYESHLLSEKPLANVNEAFLATEDGYWPKKTYTVFAGGASDGLIEYTPEKHFEKTYLNAVTYGMPGMDISQISVTLLQMGSSELESQAAIRRLHPLVKDAERARRQIFLEKMEAAMMGGFTQHIFDGTTPLIDSIAAYRALRGGKELVDAIEAADKAARDRQATAAPPPAEGQAVAPEQTAGLALPGQGAEAPPPNTPGPTDSQVNLEQLLFTLGQPRKQAV